MASELNPTIIGHRYYLHDRLGAGGMGAVYRTTDRLTGQLVALKRVLPAIDRAGFAPKSENGEANLRLALAQEFQVLASLRHPHIVGVLDYGFSLDATRQPYFTMELLPNAQTILEAGRGQPLAMQVDLLVQTLQALAYLHRRQIIHRDLKPSNVLVIPNPGRNGSKHKSGLVKVLDFGLSMAAERAGGTLGTLAYMAPEVLDGHPAGVAADLYAVGVIAYELFTGHHPFNTSRITALVADIMNTEPDVERAGLTPPLAAILKRLLAKEPADRYAEAGQVIEAFSAAIGRPLAVETKATRESFLQAARLVGREAELDQLETLLAQLRAGQGAAWLVGGESGVGKSRLLNELRPMALVQGLLVLRGQAVSEGGNPYHLWRAPLRWLSLLASLDDLAAGVLKMLVPDLPALLGRDLPDPPELDPQAIQTRLLMVIEAMVRHHSRRQPILLILEDLHWAGSESLAVLTRLNRLADELPLLIIGSYRDDERPDLPAILPGMKVLKLNRLSEADIAELSESMLGQAGRQPELLDLLQRETEGNVFFLVEVVRVLAEEAGQLERISQINLPRRVITGGVQRVIQHRLNRIASADLRLLRVAAVMGRQLDLAVLRKLDPDLALEEWLTRCADAAVLDVQDDHWRFAHDKLRDSLLANLSSLEQRALHRQVATAIEAVYPDASDQMAALAHHWGLAGDAAKEGYYAALAGEQALQSGAYQEAITFLERALTLALQDQAKESTQAQESAALLRRVSLKRQLGEAHLGLGDMSQSRIQLEQALGWLGWPVPRSGWQLWPHLAGQILRQALHLLWPDRFLKRARRPERLLEATQIGVSLGLIYYLARETLLLLTIGLLTLNLGEMAGPSPGLARSYANMSVIAGLIPLHPLARIYGRRAWETAENVGQLLSLAWVLTVTGVYKAGVGRWAEAQNALERAVEICDRLGDRRRWEESLSQLAMVHFLQGQFSRSAARYAEVYASARRRGDPQLQAWGLNGQARSLLALGRLDEAMELLASAQKLLSAEVGPLSGINTYGTLALAHWRQGRPGRAGQAADQAAQLIARSPRSSYYILQGYACVAEVYLLRWEAAQTHSDGKQLQAAARRACAGLRKFARVFPMAMPQAWLRQGLYDWLSGHPAKAHKAWQKSLAYAEQLAMPYEQGLAHFEIGRHLAANDPARQDHLTRAGQIFTQLEAAYDLARTKQAAKAPGLA